MKMSMAMQMRLLHRFASFLAVAALGFLALMPLPAMAMPTDHLTITFATMANKADAKAKEVEGKLESAAGALTGDTGKQIKGNAKQVQASAMKAGENMKDGAKSVAKKIGNAADNIANDKS